jgi:hypothetical protein
VPREVAGVERVPDAEREHEQRQRDISRRRPVPPTRRRPESRRGVGQARIRVRGAQDAEHLAQLVDGLAAGPLDRGKRPAGTLGLAHEHLFGARRLQHLTDRLRLVHGLGHYAKLAVRGLSSITSCVKPTATEHRR